MHAHTHTGAETFRRAYFGQGTGPILLDDLGCSGDEASLVDCRHDGVGQYDGCDHSDDAGLRCQNSKLPVSPLLSLKLRNLP